MSSAGKSRRDTLVPGETQKAFSPFSYFSSWIYYKKHNLKIASTRNEAGVRVYHAER
jgi:hypothetical protein